MTTISGIMKKQKHISTTSQIRMIEWFAGMIHSILLNQLCFNILNIFWFKLEWNGYSIYTNLSFHSIQLSDFVRFAILLSFYQIIAD